MDIFIVAIRILLAAVLAALIGIDREIKNRAAGFRTHIIVSVGACLITLIGVDAIGGISSDPARDTARLAGQVVSGIGFLGAGTILQKKNGVTGLTTAATLWLSGAIGLAVGIGYYEGAIIATVICLITLISLKAISDLINKKISKSYSMTFNNNFDKSSFYAFVSQQGVEVRQFDIIDEDMDDKSIIEMTLSFRKNYDISGFFDKLKSDYNLQSFKLK